MESGEHLNSYCMKVNWEVLYECATATSRFPSFDSYNSPNYCDALVCKCCLYQIITNCQNQNKEIKFMNVQLLFYTNTLNIHHLLKSVSQIKVHKQVYQIVTISSHIP